MSDRTKLGGTKRTILRALINASSEASAALDAMHGGAAVSTLPNAELLQLADVAGIPVPCDAAAAAYDSAKAASLNAVEAMVEAAQAQALHEAGGTTSDPVSAPVSTPAPKADPVETAAQARVQGIHAAFASGDVVKYRDDMLAMAREACRPDPAPIMAAPVQNYDTSHLSGEVAKIADRKKLSELPNITTQTPVNDDATAMDLYDAGNAPAVDPGYIWPAHTGPIVAALANQAPVFLYGPAGTGKTTFAEQIAATYKRPFVRISCDDQTEAAVLSGMTVPDLNGGTKWQDGQLAKAIRRPGTVILIDEPSVARPGALFVLQSVLDDGRCMNIAETGERIPVAPGVLFILADNTNGTGDETGAYEATRRLNRAFLDRPNITVKLDYMSAQDEARALHGRTGLGKKACGALVKLANLTRSKTDDGDLSHAVGFRRLCALAKQLRFGTPADVAFQISVLETAPSEDRETLRQLWTAEVKKGDLADA